MILVCHVFFHDHLIKVSCDIPITVSHHPIKFGGDKPSSSGDMFLVYHVIPNDHGIKGSRKFEWEPLKVSHHPARFCGHSHNGIGDMFSWFKRKIPHALT